MRSGIIKSMDTEPTIDSREGEPSHYPILIVGEIEFTRGIGYTKLGFIEREYGERLQQYFIEALQANAYAIIQLVGGSLVGAVKSSLSSTDRVYTDFKSYISIGEEKIRLPEHYALFPQDLFVRGESGGILVSECKVGEKEERYGAYLVLKSFLGTKGILLEKIHVEKDDRFGEGGRYQVGHNIVFFGGSLSEQERKKIEDIFLGKRVIDIPVPKDLEIKDPTKTNSHIDQFIGPDIYISDPDDPYILIPIHREYYEAVKERGINLPNYIEPDGKRLKVEVMPISGELLQYVELLNVPCIQGKIFLTPILAKMVEIYIKVRREGRSPIEEIRKFEEKLAKLIPPIPNSEMSNEQWWEELRQEEDGKLGVLIYRQKKFFDKYLERQNSKDNKVFPPSSLDLDGVIVLPSDVPATTYYKAGLKCKINWV